MINLQKEVALHSIPQNYMLGPESHVLFKTLVTKVLNIFVESISKTKDIFTKTQTLTWGKE